ncbi:MAG: branched-chain amino acid ABC transporter permease, partial [Oscillospiraceae bacterium]
MTNVNTKKRNIVLTILLLAVLLIGINFLNDNVNSYLRRILSLCAVYTIMGLSLNLVNGFTGMFSLGQAGFMAIGASTVAIFTVPVAFIVALILGGIIAAFFAFLIGAPVLRLKGDYLAIATLGFSEIIRIVFTNAQTITNGALGIKGIPTITSLGWTMGTAIIIIIL